MAIYCLPLLGGLGLGGRRYVARDGLRECYSTSPFDGRLATRGLVADVVPTHYRGVHWVLPLVSSPRQAASPLVAVSAAVIALAGDGSAINSKPPAA